ncbi:hypothetical protein BJV77DRAFT_987653 [Russula vinacea]|nr:hypothetical protein BJV77DRAFT_987653 [Russula vinacea]
MLKRQRASSPSPVTPVPATEVPLISSAPTSSEHGVKRRRMLTPPSDGRSRVWDTLPVPPEDDVDEDDIMGDGSPTPSSGTGEYKAVNSLLHDLHAEQQHRRLMSPSSHSSSSSPGPPIQDVPLVKKYPQGLLASETKNRVYCGDDVSVYDRYEETNKLLGLVFLERRRGLSSQWTHNIS